LPDLPGIAGDISFSISDQELIAPSLAKMNIINELPNVADLIEAETKKVQEVPKVVATPVPSVPVAAIPPPPPIPQNVIPPPPPIPAAMPVAAKSSEPTPKVPQPDDARSSLMQAIRNAAGKKTLKSIPAADEQAPAESKKKAAPAPAGDLMSDLHAKLALRRRGIAGSKEAKKEKPSILDKVSSLIPPPSKRSESDDDSDSTDNDWD
jgi:WAS family protein 1